eukprot:TRINITY_DN11737_c0_g1_i1.p1 TRINITY_DN11737_c0_g1~~TRINITY_DN11737_c0_g1_i1.p1  ORF type:complete len:348 (-),score=42.14 TRINITY_DN11737_c0_g1_i1:61-1104(-)
MPRLIPKSPTHRTRRQEACLPWGIHRTVLHQFRAGLLRREGSLIKSDERKGKIIVYKDKILSTNQIHLTWIDRKTKLTELDLTISQKATKVEPIPQCKTGYAFSVKTGREIYFFWMQEPSNHRQLLKNLDFFIGSRRPNQPIIQVPETVQDYNYLLTDQPCTCNQLLPRSEDDSFKDCQNNPDYVMAVNQGSQKLETKEKKPSKVSIQTNMNEDQIWEALLKAEESTATTTTITSEVQINIPEPQSGPVAGRDKIEVNLRKHSFAKLMKSLENNNISNIEQLACGLEMKIYLQYRGQKNLYKSKIISTAREIDVSTRLGQQFQAQVPTCSCNNQRASFCDCVCHIQN